MWAHVYAFVLMVITLALTGVGLLITELHFYRNSITSEQYVTLVMFFYGGGVLGKLLPVIVGLLMEKKRVE
jgi:hypothetical protein